MTCMRRLWQGVFAAAVCIAPATGLTAEPTGDSAEAVAREIAAGLKADRERKPWEGVYASFRPFGSRVLYVGAEHWAIPKKQGGATGRLILRDGLVELAGQPKGEEPEKFYLISWGKRVYLIDETRLVDFINAVNDGSEAAELLPGNFLVRDTLGERATGSPELPEKYRAYLFTEPYRAVVTRVLGRLAADDPTNTGFSGGDFEIEIEPEAARPLLPGIKLHVETGGKSYVANITAAAGKNYRARVVGVYNSTKEHPAVGDALTSRPKSR